MWTEPPQNNFPGSGDGVAVTEQSLPTLSTPLFNKLQKTEWR